MFYTSTLATPDFRYFSFHALGNWKIWTNIGSILKWFSNPTYLEQKHLPYIISGEITEYVIEFFHNKCPKTCDFFFPLSDLINQTVVFVTLLQFILLRLMYSKIPSRTTKNRDKIFRPRRESNPYYQHFL